MFNIKDWIPGSMRSRTEAPPPDTSATPRQRSPPPRLSSQFNGTSISAVLEHIQEPAARATPRPPLAQVSALFDVMSISSSPKPAPEPVTDLSLSSQVPESSTDSTGSNRDAAATIIASTTVRSPSPQFEEAFNSLSISSSETQPQAHEPLVRPSALSLPRQRPEKDDTGTDCNTSKLVRPLDGCTFIRQQGSHGKNRTRLGTLSGKVTKKNKSSTTTLQQTPGEKKNNLEKLRNRVRSRELKSALKSRRGGKGEPDVPGGSSLKHKGKKAVRFSNDDSSSSSSHPRIPTDSEVPSVRAPRHSPPPGMPDSSAMKLPYESINDMGVVPTRSTLPPMEAGALGLTGLNAVTVVKRLTAESIRIPVNDYDYSSVEFEASNTKVIAPVGNPPATAEEMRAAEAYLACLGSELRAAAEHSTSTAYLTPERPNPGLCADSNRSTSSVESPLPKTPDSPTDSEAAVRSPKLPGYEEVFGRSDDEDNDDLGPSPRRKNEKFAAAENAPTPLAPRPTLTETVVVPDTIPAQTTASPPPTTSMVAPQREMSWTTLPITTLPIPQHPFEVRSSSAFTQSSIAWGQAAHYQTPPPCSWSQSAFSAPSLTSAWSSSPQPAPSLFQSPAAFCQPVFLPRLSSFIQHTPVPQSAIVDMSMDVDPSVDLAMAGPRSHRQRAGNNCRQAARHLLRVIAIKPIVGVRKRAARRLFQNLFNILQRPTGTNTFGDGRDMRRSPIVRRHDRKGLRQARRSVRPILKRIIRVAPEGHGSPRCVLRPVQRTMSIEMAIEESFQTSVHCPDEDIDMEGGDLPVIPVIVEVDGIMASEPAIPPPALLVRSASELAMSVEISVPTIVVTPGSPLLGSPSQEKPHSAPAHSSSSLVSSSSFTSTHVMTGHSEKQKAQTTSPLRQENSLAEFEVPLVEAAAPAATSGSEPEPEPPVVVEPTPVTVDEHTPAVVEAGSFAVVEPTPAVVLEPAPAGVPEATVKTKPPVTETRIPVTEPPPAAEETGYETDDETEWEPVPVPPVPSVSHAPPIAKLAVVEENTPTSDFSPVEQEGSAEALAPADIPAPNIATEGPQIVFQSYTYDVDDDDTVSLGGSEEDDEYYEDHGREESGNEEDYEDDGRAEEESEAEYTDDDRGEEDDEEEDEYESTADEDGEEVDEESNEYDESPPNYGVVKRPSCSASAPVSASVSLPTSASPLTTHPALDPVAPSPVSFVPPGLPEGAYIGTVGEGFDWSTEHNKRMQSLANTANVSSGNPLSGEAAMRARNEARRRNYENQVRQKTGGGGFIRDVTAGEQLNTVPPPVLPKTITHPVPGEAPIVVDKDVPELQSRDQDHGTPKQVWKGFLVLVAEDAETVEPRLHKGKGKGTDLDALLEDHALVLDASSEENIRALDLTPAKVQFNLPAFSKADAKGEAPPSYQCHCRNLENGPSRGHTLTCKLAHGVVITPTLAPRPSLSPTPAPCTPPTRQHSESSMLQTSPQTGQFSSVAKTDVNTTFVDQGELKSTPPSIGLATNPVVDEEPPPDYEFVKGDANLELTGVAMPCNDLFVTPAGASTVMQSGPEPEELSTAAADCILPSLPSSTHPPTTVDPSTSDICGETRWVSDVTAAAPPLPHDDAAMDYQTRVSHAEATLAPELDLSFTVDHNLPLDERRLNLLSWIPETENVFDIGADVVPQQDTVFALPVAGNADGSMSVPIHQVQESDNAASSTEEQEEVGEVEAETISYSLAAPSNDEHYDRSSEMTVQVDVPVHEQPQPESEPAAQVLAAGSPSAENGTESSLPEATGLQSPHPSEPPLSASVASQSLVDLAAPLHPARAPRPPAPAPPAPAENEITHPVEEAHAEASDGADEASPVNEQEVEEENPAPEVAVPPSTPLVRRLSGGPHDRIASPQVRRTYFGPHPCPAQWNAFLRPSPPNANRVPSYCAKKAASSSTSPTTHPAARPCGVIERRTTSTSTDTTAIREPAPPRSTYRERSCRQSTIPRAMYRSKSKKDVAKTATKGGTCVTAIKACKGNGDRRGKEEAHGPCPFVSAPSASHTPCLSPTDRPSTHQAPSLPSWTKLPCCPDFSWTGREPCIHSLRASGQLAGTRWESESSDSELEEKDVPSSEQGWSAGYLAKLSLAVGAFYLLERVVF